MGRSFNFLEWSPTYSVQDQLNSNSLDFNAEEKSSEHRPSDEHPLMATIREAITQYRMQSAAHFDRTIDVKQAFRAQDMELSRQSKVNVIFSDLFGPERLICSPVFRKQPHKKTFIFTGKVEVWKQGRFVPLNDFLSKRFPCFFVAMGDKEMKAWWNANGKDFNWVGLPTELKEQVIAFCIHNPLNQTDFRRKQLARKRNRLVSNRESEFGVYEIVSKLTNWNALLGVSHQVRAITLRLCFIGSSDLIQGKGFSIDASSPRGLDKTLSRLGGYYTMVEANSMPVDYDTQALSDCYMHFPRMYSHLKQYATFRHGIRRISLGMTFYEYMRFFRVTVGGFRRYLNPEVISYEVFEQLPHLSEVAIQLPDRPRRGWCNILLPGPLMFHHDSPCPRILHRIIYEKAVETLTLYPHLKVTGFVDQEEEARFNQLRATSLKNAEWTAAEYEELYDECGGGISLEEMVQPGSWTATTEDEQMESELIKKEVVPVVIEQAVDDDFFPPKCRCAEKCNLLLN
ncbi:hypothetical protein CC86DRAFT_66102 [Ophiobolus disseminans]|uniref:Uncharacterized protein n=1 Tax=Ophiobolus disseminans TaxID=1469910 RepID=A0A6A6ZSR3_9PLEO|nr:hypothetical protein CC86DRAFT_66102 [Ophiobolus disseminans]